MAAEHNTGIYEIRNVVNGKRYVGSAVSFKTRWSKHLSQLRRGVHHSKILQRSWDKHGESAFEFRPLLLCDREHLLMYEQAAIDALSPDYNVCRVAGTALGVKRSKESLQRGVATRRSGAGWMKNSETRQKISSSLIGRKGKPCSAQQRAVLSAKTKGIVTDHIVALAKAKRGVPRPEDVREKLSKASASLLDHQVREIRGRCRAGEKQIDVASDFGIRQSCVSEIVRHVSYKWVN